MPQAPTWEETVSVPSWEDTVDESQPTAPKETEQEFVQRMGKPIVPTKAQLNEPRSPKELFEPFKKIPRVDSSDPRFRAAVVGILGKPASEDTLSSVAAALNSAAGFTEGIESPAGVATTMAGPLGKVAQKLAALGWGAYSAAQVPEAARTAGELSVTGTPQEKKEAYIGLAGSIAIPAAIGAGVVGESPARGLAKEISKAIPKFEDTSPIPITERGERAPLPTDRVKELISNAEPILPKAAKEASVSVEEQARLQKELAEELGKEPAVEQIVPAIKTMSGEVVAGEKGQSHNDIIEQNKIPAKEVDRREFVDTATGQEVSREKLATAIPTKKEGEAHSSDLAKAQEAVSQPLPTNASFDVRVEGVGEDARAASRNVRNMNRPDHVYRGMTEAEFNNTIGKGSGVESRRDFSFGSEGTSFSGQAEDAESYVNYGRDDPRTTGKPNYIVEVKRTPKLVKNRQGYFESKGSIPIDEVTRIWKIEASGNKLVASEVKRGEPAPTPEPPPTPAPVKAEPSAPPPPSGISPTDKGITKEEKAFRATSQGQKAMASRAARIGTLHTMNEAIRKIDPNEAFDRRLIDTLPDSQIDAWQEDLRQSWNKLLAGRGKPTPTSAPSSPEPAPPPPAQPKGETGGRTKKPSVAPIGTRVRREGYVWEKRDDGWYSLEGEGNAVRRPKADAWLEKQWKKPEKNVIVKAPSETPTAKEPTRISTQGATPLAEVRPVGRTTEAGTGQVRGLRSEQKEVEPTSGGVPSTPDRSREAVAPPTPPPVEQKGVEPGSPLPPGFQGPGAARVGDVPAAPPQAIAAGAKVEQAPPESRPMGFASTLGVAINNARQAIRGLGTTLKGFAGATMPKTTARDRLLGEAGARYLSSRIAARPLAASFSARVLQDTNVDPFKFGAALTEDNLRSVRESLRQKATELTAEGKTAEADLMTQKADDVKTIIGSKGSPFADEEAYFDFLDQPNTKKAIAQHLQLWQEVIDPQYKEAQGIDPDVELPSRGQQTGARINLKAVLPDQPATQPVMGSSSGLTATFKRKSPFGIKAKGTGQAYDIDYHSIIRNTFERQLEIANKNAFDRMLEQTGNAVVDKPGRTIDIGGEPAVAFPLSRKIIIATGEEGPKSFSQAKNIYVRKDLADEYRAASNVDRRYRWPVITPIMNGLNRAALAGLTDATVHVSNQMTALFNRPTSGKFWTDTLLSATGRADVPVTLVRTILKAFKDNQLQEAELAKIGAMRQQGDIHYGVFGRVLQHTDKLTRLVLDDTFKGLVKEGLVENTETARREYVNQIGQYNRRAQGLITRAARDIGFGPFVTAGKTFNALGVRMATLSPGAPAANGFAAAALRANVLSKWIGGAVVVGTMNYLITGKMMGRPGTPLGNIDTGKNDKSGKQLSLPFLSLLGLGRGLRVTGAKGAIDAKRMGLTDSDAIDAATRDIINSWTSPFAGPPVKFGLIAATGYQPAVNVGRASRVVPPGESQFNQNVGDAIRQSSPVIQTYIKAREGKSVPEILSTQVPRFTMQPGKSESMVANYPKIVSMAQGAAFIDDMIHEARRMDPDKRRQFVIEQVRRLPPAQWDHAFREVARRRVYK